MILDEKNKVSPPLCSRCADFQPKRPLGGYRRIQMYPGAHRHPPLGRQISARVRISTPASLRGGYRRRISAQRTYTHHLHLSTSFRILWTLQVSGYALPKPQILVDVSPPPTSDCRYIIRYSSLNLWSKCKSWVWGQALTGLNKGSSFQRAPDNSRMFRESLGRCCWA